MITHKDAKWLVERFKENNYQKVLNGRPLVYVFSATATLASAAYSVEKFKQALRVFLILI
ncbi:MAG: hypothetical protein M9933_13065 [Chitinophagaceae bacterium]|nr:hypothetical protein [Chitinophagaceae bacterium]